MPVEPTAERLRRIMVMVPWVIHRGAPTVEEVCERFGLTPKELAADIDLLMVCGLAPFTPGDLIEAFIEGGRVTISMAHALERPPRLTRSEALVLLVAGRAIAALPGVEAAPSLPSALRKLASAIAPAASAEAEALADRVAMSLGTEGDDVLAVLRDAVASRARLRMSYYSAGRDELTEREIDPMLVFGAAGSWYVVAFDHNSDEERPFRVDRIKQIAATGASFEPRADFDPTRYQREPLFTASEKDIEAVLDLAPSAGWLTEVVAAETVEQLDDGRTRVRLRTPQLPWLVRLLLSAGPDATVVSPPELAAAVRDAASQALRAYASA